MPKSHKNYEINWLGYHNARHKDHRIWGYLTMTSDNRIFAFWGSTGSETISFRLQNSVASIRIIANKHKSKGYGDINPDHYLSIDPNFGENLDVALMAALLSDKY